VGELSRASTLTQLGAFNFDLDLYVDPEPNTAFGDPTIRINREVHGVVKCPMDHCLHAFRMWIEEHLESTFEGLCEGPQTMALGLRGYGQFLYEHGYPRYFLVCVQSLLCKITCPISEASCLLHGR